ncbi:MAG: NADH-quinone oxidoreductase subunit NuoE [Anaerolineales bacterium]|nr:NADH-quinone oxidoreductase subunit NuoE [Anaerolineales bacterium]
MENSLETIFSEFEGKREDIIPILQKVQEEYTYLPDHLMAEIAEYTRVPPSDIYGVATFYAQFRFTPTGENIISVCRGTACHVRGAPRIFEEITDQLGLEGEGTTEDQQYTVETVACVGCCALAPVITINEEVYGDLTKKKVQKIIKKRGNENGQ